MLSTPITFAQDAENENNGTLFEPVQKQIIQIDDKKGEDNWEISKLETYGLKFLVRGKEALTWSLNIENAGFHNKAIEKSYSKVLSIVNALFILGMLAIAGMWIFSTLIPKSVLKKVIFIYSMAVIFINFALPINQLFIDGSNLLQKTLLTEKNGSIQITDIVQTPNYNEIIAYKRQNENNLLENAIQNKINFKIYGSDEATTSIGKIKSIEGDELKEETISLNNQTLSFSSQSKLDLNQEQNIFRFLIILATGIAYFIIALIFVIRIIILWALLILSPILLLLAIFHNTRAWFLNWLSIYGRWLLIGPLTALGISIVVNIWQINGLPISMNETYSSETFSIENTSNIAFYLPGKDEANTLKNGQEMMEYLVFLIMLYLPIFIGWALTRRKIMHESLTMISKQITKSTKSSQQIIQQLITKQNGNSEEENIRKNTNIIDNFKNLINDKITLFTENAMPIDKLKIKTESKSSIMPTASNFLPENLKTMAIPKILELLGQKRDSKSSHQKVIEKLTNTHKIQDAEEKKKFTAVRKLIESMVREKNPEALSIAKEMRKYIENKEEKEDSSSSNEALKLETTKTDIILEKEERENELETNINIQIGDKKPENDRKTRDSSFDSKSEEKGEKEKKKEEEKDKEEDSNKEKKTKDKNNNKEKDTHNNSFNKK